jgi:tRNA (adenine22-N1)-methyltransferase
LDKRLEACADFVKGARACDIGTDHGRLAAFLLLSGKCETVIAGDLNEKPLSCAKALLERRGVSRRAEFFLADGLQGIPLDGVTDIVIAGMGGETIAGILSRRLPELCGINIVLQPMTKLAYLKFWLKDNGFIVVGEKVVTVRKHCYTVLNAWFSSETWEV